MSSSSSFSSESSESSSSPDTTPAFPSSALAAAAASRMRRYRRDAISLQAESEWDVPAPPAPPTTPLFSTGWSWTGGNPVPPTTTPGVPLAPAGDSDEQLICPLASLPFLSPSSQPPPPPPPPFSSFAFPPPDQADDGNVDTDELQATLSRFAFPSPTRKHRRSGESIDHHHHHSAAIPPPSSVVVGGGGATRRCGTGPVKRAQCAHCDHARTSV